MKPPKIAKAQGRSVAECQTKVCALCREDKDVGAFFKNRTRKVGIRPRCKDCERGTRSAYHVQWYMKNKDLVSDRDRSRYRANSASVNERTARYYETNRDNYAEWNRAWRKANPAKVRRRERNRRAKELGAAGHHTVDDVVAIRKKQKDRCVYCMVSLKSRGHIDHIIALSRGGTNWPSNLQLLCRSCNLRKGDKDHITFAQASGLLL